MTDAPPSKKAKMSYDGPDLELKCINTIRAVSADQPQAANSGHPGAPMGCAPMAHLLWNEVMTYSASDPKWINRDRFVLSNGHACALQYTMLHLAGYGLSVEDLKQFRKLGSKTPGHPESFVTAGVEVCTGPLGQGISNAVGLAIAEKHLAASFNTPDMSVFDNFTYVICGDGCLQEGVSSEACSLAGHLGLGKLIVLYDDNKITIDGHTDLSFSEDVGKRYEAYGWQVLTVDDVAGGIKSLRDAVNTAKAETDKPTIIKISTVIGYGSPSKANTHAAHGAPLGPEDLAGTKEFYGLDPTKSFQIDDDVKAAYATSTEAGETKKKEWDAMYAKYKEANPEKAAELERRFSGKLPDGIADKLPKFEIGKDKDKPRSVDECKAMQEEIWGIKSSGTRFRYPLRYQLDIVSHKEWYDSHGVEQFFIIVVRDQDASRVARSDHCRNEKLKLEEERVGTDIIVDAINRYILKDGEKKVTRDNYQFWAAESYNTVEKNLKGRRLQATGLPSGNNVVLVSYELLVKLGQAYVKTLYAALGIESNHVPNIKNGNSKYIDGTGKKIPRKRPRTKNVNNSQENSMALDASKEVNSRQENANSRVTRRQEPQPVKNLRRKRIHSHMLNQYSVRRQDYN